MPSSPVGHPGTTPRRASPARSRPVVAAIALPLAVLAMLAPSGAAAAAGGASTLRVSVDRAGGDADANSDNPDISAGGGHVVFSSFATDLVAGDRQGHQDVFRRELGTGTTTRVSVDRSGGSPNSDSSSASVSADGRYVAFTSWASDLVAGDLNEGSDVFVRDVVAGTTTRVSVDPAGGDADGGSEVPSISASGRYVSFTSPASDLVAGDGNGTYDVFVRDLVAGRTTLVSVDAGGDDADSLSYNASISADGRHVVFTSFAGDLVAGDGNGVYDVFRRDLVAGSTIRVSVDATGGDAEADSFGPSVSATGRYVAFFSGAADIVPPDGNGLADVFVRDTLTGTTTRVSVDSTGAGANGRSYGPSISGTGRYVAFFSQATDLTAEGDANRADDVFARDLATGRTTRVSVDTAGGDPDGISISPSISATGRYVAFASSAPDLVAGDGDSNFDVFVRDLA